MIFNSLEFIIFLVLVFWVYWKLERPIQNLFIVIASYIFYGWWNWRFLFLIFISSTISFLLGNKIYNTGDTQRRKIYLTVNVISSLGILGFFKYFNFFVSSLQELFISVGAAPLSVTTLNVILPVGISFYTFKELSYAIDIYRRKVPAAGSFIEFLAFVSFFPQLIAGPIDRAQNFLVQFKQERVFKTVEAIDGCRQMLWGFFKKIFIADTLAVAVNSTYNNLYSVSGSQLLIATVLFAFQLYADFSGYSDIAIGTAKLFGFRLMNNFNYPYFSRNIAEFWRRWHISLSEWLRDYLYYPLVFSRKNKTKTWIYISMLITFTLIGLWHGAGWNYIAMGVIFGSYLVLDSIIRDTAKSFKKYRCIFFDKD